MQGECEAHQFLKDTIFLKIVTFLIDKVQGIEICNVQGME